MHNLSYESEFYVDVNENSFSYERLCTKTHLERGSEWEYLNNTKHLIFGLCNIKQLYFRHFNTNSKKFTVTVNFIQKETKLVPKLSESSPNFTRSF